MSDKKNWPYEDIVNLPHHVSKRHPPMPMNKRAAQFMPFAALTGYEDAVEETARVTEEKKLLSEDALEELDRRIAEAIITGAEVRIRFFVPDKKKTGGKYEVMEGRIRSAEMGELRLLDGRKIRLDAVVSVGE